MSETNVVALDESFEEDLPVCLDDGFGCAQQLLLGGDEHGQVFRAARWTRVGILGDEDEAELLLGLQRVEAVRLLVQPRRRSPGELT